MISQNSASAFVLFDVPALPAGIGHPNDLKVIFDEQLIQQVEFGIVFEPLGHILDEFGQIQT